MPAYVIADVDVRDPVRYEQYKQLVPGTLAAFGGRFLVRGGAAETLEGAWHPNRLVVLEFESVERAKAWWASEAYRAPRALRQRASEGSLIVVGGVDGASG